MRIAIYYPWVHLMSGAERLLLELTGRSRHEWTIVTNRYDQSRTYPGLAERTIVQLPAVSVKRSMAKVAAAAWRVATQRLPLDGHDALVVLCEGVGDLAVFRNAQLPTFCICLTPLRPAFDEKYRAHALERSGFLRRCVLPPALFMFAVIDRIAWRRYRRVFCISEEVRRRVVAGRLAAPREIEVLHVPVSTEKGFDTEPVFERFFLLPGRIMWTKNIGLGIAAFKQFCAESRRADFKLVIAGMVDAKSEGYFADIRRLAGDDSRIEFRIAPTDDEMAELYRTCYAVLFTAFNEDWGLIPLEAMAFAKPVIATDSGGPRESVTPATGFLAHPDASEFARKMDALSTDPEAAKEMGRAGRARARQFSWDHYVRRIDDALAEISPAGQAVQKTVVQPGPSPLDVSQGRVH